jgi:putative nucleotidyltransferase with HDIG domain
MRKWSGRRAAPEAEDPAGVVATLTPRSNASRIDVAALLAELPMQQAATSRALAVLDDPNASAQEIAAVLESDPALCARALQLANSAHFGMSGKITSVDQAVVTLGGMAMRTLVVSTASGMFGGPDDLPPGFWSHSVAVAAASAIAARLYSVPRGDAICAGLLHDLGAALLFRHDRTGSAARMAAGTNSASTLIADEIEAYGADHAELGADALAAWKLPATVVNALRAHHHQPLDTDNRLARVVIAGEALARAAFAEPPFSHEPTHEPASVFDALGLRIASVDTLIERTTEETSELSALLGN